MMTREHRQEALSRAYITAIAARCGFSCSYREVDYGMDMTIIDIFQQGTTYAESGCRLDVQAKSTIAAGVTPTQIQYDLDVRAYNILRLGVFVPRLLILLVLPADERLWTTQTEDSLELRHCAYWAIFRGMAPTKNKRTIRITIPRTNVLSVAGLTDLMTQARNGGAI